MSAIQGFPSNQKVPLGTGITNNFTTVIPTDPNRAALDVPRFAFRVNDPLNARTAGPTTGIEIVDGVKLFWVDDTATPARPGDFVRFETGPAAFLEIPIVKVETNRFLLAVNSGILPVATNTFFIMRYATQRVDNTGSQVVIASPGPTQYVLNGLDVEVEEDAVTPANNKPLPVKIFDSGNVPFDPATEATLLLVDASVNAVDTTLQTIDFATETTLSSIDTKTPALVGGSVPVVGPLTDAELRASAVPVSAASLPLPTGAATEATLGLVEIHTEAAAIILNEAATGVQALSVVGPLTNTELRAAPVDIAASSLPLPTGAATETTLDALNTKVSSDFGASSGAVRTAAQVGNASGAADFGAGNASAQTLRAVLATDQTPIPTSQTINTGSFAQITNLVATAQTFTAPANAVGFKIQAPSTNTENIAFSIGATATITAGILMEPGRSEDFDVGSNISVIATSATQQTVNVLWKVRP